MKRDYLTVVSLIEKLHRQFLDVLGIELDRLGVGDVNSVQALLLYNIGDDELSIGELTLRGCYPGTNVTYNLKKLGDCDYITQRRSLRDRRTVFVALSPRGKALRARLDKVFDRHAAQLSLGALQTERFKEVEFALGKLESYWTKYVTAPARRSAADPPVEVEHDAMDRLAPIERPRAADVPRSAHGRRARRE